MVRELVRRGMSDAALGLGDCHVAARYEGPAVEELGDTALIALVSTFSPCTGSVTAAT
ncbi:MAG: hypothetical protein K1X95_07185 [Acidimicrobiia bacterium]|nr:hypothetical protein [Acidimicrobiia bacterium]